MEKATAAGVPVLNVNDAVIPSAAHYVGNVQKGNGVNVANWFIWALEIITHSADQPGGVSFTPGFFTQWDRNDLPPSLSTGTRGPGPASRPELSSWLGEYPCTAMAVILPLGGWGALRLGRRRRRA